MLTGVYSSGRPHLFKAVRPRPGGIPTVWFRQPCGSGAGVSNNLMGVL